MRYKFSRKINLLLMLSFNRFCLLAKLLVSENMSETQQLLQIKNVLADIGDVNTIPTAEVCLMCYAVFNSVVMLRKLGVPKEFLEL